jgi:hypothetical protein
MEGVGKGLGTVIIICMIAAAVVFWGGVEGVKRIFRKEFYETHKPLKPEKIDIIVKNGVADTTYYYKIR